MSDRRLIVNADDFARSPGVSEGILRAHEGGIVTTTTAMMNLPDSRNAVQDAHKRFPTLGLGVHLNITFGQPISPPEEVRSLVNPDGHFRNFRDLLDQPATIDLTHVEREWRLQIESFLGTGTPLDHLDSHHHSAVFSAGLFELLLRLASEYECGVRNPKPEDQEDTELQDLYNDQILVFVQEEALQRMQARGIPHPDGFLASFFAGKATVPHLKNLLTHLRPGTFELMCHPGILDRSITEQSSYAGFREQELEVLTDPAVRSLIEESNIELTTYQTAWRNG